MRVAVYVDGFNLYYRALRGTRYKWLDIAALSREILDVDDTVEFIRYFTAIVSPRAGDEGAPTRQEAYLRALRTIPNLTIHHGRFLPKTKFRPLVADPSTYVEIHDTEEKGSDVSLAAHLLNDGFRNRYDAALIVSQDTDLCEPLRMVKHDLRKIVGIVWSDSTSPGKRHKKVSDFIRHANTSILGRSQFPDPVIGKGGMKIPKPAAW